VSLAAKGEYSTHARGLSTTPGFPTSGCWRRPRVRFSLKKTACRSSTPRLSTGNPGERSGEISVWMLLLGEAKKEAVVKTAA
jgi:hypothetical protein